LKAEGTVALPLGEKAFLAYAEHHKGTPAHVALDLFEKQSTGKLGTVDGWGFPKIMTKVVVGENAGMRDVGNPTGWFDDQAASASQRGRGSGMDRHHREERRYSDRGRGRRDDSPRDRSRRRSRSRGRRDQARREYQERSRSCGDLRRRRSSYHRSVSASTDVGPWDAPPRDRASRTPPPAHSLARGAGGSPFDVLHRSAVGASPGAGLGSSLAPTRAVGPPRLPRTFPARSPVDLSRPQQQPRTPVAARPFAPTAIALPKTSPSTVAFSAGVAAVAAPTAVATQKPAAVATKKQTNFKAVRGETNGEMIELHRCLEKLVANVGKMLGELEADPVFAEHLEPCRA